ncbi:hypothetical protein BSR28_03995 [Boudabousia liubingyangii]|uniref:gluconeogenesis factor YvcK family protein n=1 Tax=Boudabousia liubingyangii TaxID=1921764 RepID=UPI0009393748|nr:uridine diphosphate-N-acetylglucosamine-binding protein YvcK [Boudabousia liubingyangii]OKL47658.1 hypothetical protein BSR28_03995 [Boudabousia liubingyangii]
MSSELKPAILDPANTDLKVCALGGGHGLFATLSALQLLTNELTAIVTVADDGGSSGRLREELDCLPPGDLRMALAALCDRHAWDGLWPKVLQHRYESQGDLGGHALGNLLMVALWQVLDDPVKGLDALGELLSCRGRVLPMASEPLEITALVQTQQDEKIVRGQQHVAKANGRVKDVYLTPAEPKVPSATLEAIEEAEYIFMGPGSWYSSVIPHLLVPELQQALVSSKARKVLVLNLGTQPGETSGMSPAEHLRVLKKYAPDLRFDAVLYGEEDTPTDTELQQTLAEEGAKLYSQRLHSATKPQVHNPLLLASLMADLFNEWGRNCH